MSELLCSKENWQLIQQQRNAWIVTLNCENILELNIEHLTLVCSDHFLQIEQLIYHVHTITTSCQLYGVTRGLFLVLLTYAVLTLGKPVNFRETNNPDGVYSYNLGYDVRGHSPNARKRKFIQFSVRS